MRAYVRADEPLHKAVLPVGAVLQATRIPPDLDAEVGKLVPQAFGELLVRCDAVREEDGHALALQPHTRVVRAQPEHQAGNEAHEKAAKNGGDRRCPRKQVDVLLLNGESPGRGRGRRGRRRRRGGRHRRW